MTHSPIVRIAALVAFGALGQLVAAGCGQPASLEGHPCPCADGYFCCGAICVANGSSCDGVPPDGGGLPDGGGATDAQGDSGNDASDGGRCRRDAGNSSRKLGGFGADAGFKDAGTFDGGTCSPSLPAGFTSTWKPPAAHQNACTQAMIDAIIAGCYGDTATQSACQSATSAADAKTCSQCIETPSTAAAWGPIVLTSQTGGFYNFGGCVAMADGDGSATGCGAKVRTAFDCTSQACSSCDPNNTSAFDACSKATESGACKTQWDAMTCVDTEAEGGKPAVGECFAGSTGAEFLAVAVPLFCLDTTDDGC